MRKRTLTLSAPVPSEAAEQEALIRWSEYHWFKHYLFAVPNGGLRDIRTARRLKLQGVKAGVPDMMLAIPSVGWHGLFLEMKRVRGSKVTSEQKTFLARVAAMGYRSEVAYGWKHASEIILEYLEQSKEKRDASGLEY